VFVTVVFEAAEDAGSCGFDTVGLTEGDARNEAVLVEEGDLLLELDDHAMLVRVRRPSDAAYVQESAGLSVGVNTGYVVHEPGSVAACVSTEFVV
jgi:hypothetical protein